MSTTTSVELEETTSGIHVEDQEFTVSDELTRITEMTNEDGTVDVEILGFEKLEENEETYVEVTFRTPTLERKTNKMKWPKRDTHNYKFVRICEDTCGSLKGADFLKQDEHRIKADPDDWTLKPEATTRERLRRNLSDTTFREIVTKVSVSTFFLSAGLSVIDSITLLVKFFIPAFPLSASLATVGTFALIAFASMMLGGLTADP